MYKSPSEININFRIDYVCKKLGNWLSGRSYVINSNNVETGQSVLEEKLTVLGKKPILFNISAGYSVPIIKKILIFFSFR